uniref:WAPL domain-containing protein n=1 Tax=Ascaris lumbricoides TaxID=6252 RepID=A0A0M3I3A6_ASCLU
MSTSDLKENTNKRRSDLLKRTITTIVDSDDDEFYTPHCGATQERHPAKKAKRILGIDSPILARTERKDRTGAGRSVEELVTTSVTNLNSDTPKMAPLVNPSEFSEEQEDITQESDSSPLPTVSEDSASFVTPDVMATRLHSKLKRSSTHISEGSPLAVFGHSFSSIRLRSNTNSLFETHSSIRSMSSVQEETSNLQSLKGGNDLSTPIGKTIHPRNRRAVTQRIECGVSMVANAIMKGITTSTHTKPPPPSRNHAKSIQKLNSDCTGNAEKCVVDGKQTTKARGRLKEFKNVVTILSKELDFEAATKPLYDAIACDISPSGLPLSTISKLILQKVGKNVKGEIDIELRHSKKVFILGSGEFTLCKYVIFVVGGYSNNNDTKIWQEVRFAYFNLVNEAVQHRHIDSLLLPYLFTEESSLMQNEVAHTALTAVVLVFVQSGFTKLKKLHIGGVNINEEIHGYYMAQLESVIGNMLPDEGKENKESDTDAADNSFDNITDDSHETNMTDTNTNDCHEKGSVATQQVREVRKWTLLQQFARSTDSKNHRRYTIHF